METTDGEVFSVSFRFLDFGLAFRWVYNIGVVIDYLFRRRQLAQLGSATGVYKTLVKYLVGVPEVQYSQLL